MGELLNSSLPNIIKQMNESLQMKGQHGCSSPSAAAYGKVEWDNEWIASYIL